jgi:uncharacterized membrane protein
MLKLVVAHVSTGSVFLILDGCWLTLVGPRLYRPDISMILADKIRVLPAILFYILYIVGLVCFCVRPNLSQGWASALLSGLLLGLVAYGTYDLTCHAVMRAWTITITAADMAWGAFASAAASGAGVVITRTIVAKIGG